MRSPRNANSPDGTCILCIRDSGVVDLLCDPTAMAVWDALRSARSVCSLGEVSAAARRYPEETQRAIHRLVDLGLVAVRRARGRRATEGFLARHRSLVVAHEPDSDGDLVERVLAAMDGPGGDGAERAAGTPATRSTGMVGRFVAAAPLDPAALEELHRRIMDVIEYMRSLGMLFGADGAGSGHNAAVPIRAEIDLSAVPAGPIRHASVALLPRASAERFLSGTRSRAERHGTLTRREWDVAAALAAGGSRSEVAHRLGISANTVSSIAKGIYRKLGVRSRDGLASLLRGS